MACAGGLVAKPKAAESAVFAYPFLLSLPVRRGIGSSVYFRLQVNQPAAGDDGGQQMPFRMLTAILWFSSMNWGFGNSNYDGWLWPSPSAWIHSWNIFISRPSCRPHHHELTSAWSPVWNTWLMSMWQTFEQNVAGHLPLTQRSSNQDQLTNPTVSTLLRSAGHQKNSSFF